MGTTEKRHQWGGNPRFRTPGPGTYRPPSDFGYLDFRHMLRDNLNETHTGFDTKMDSPLFKKTASQANSLLSNKKQKRNVSIPRRLTYLAGCVAAQDARDRAAKHTAAEEGQPVWSEHLTRCGSNDGLHAVLCQQQPSDSARACQHDSYDFELVPARLRAKVADKAEAGDEDPLDEGPQRGSQEGEEGGHARHGGHLRTGLEPKDARLGGGPSRADGEEVVGNGGEFLCAQRH